MLPANIKKSLSGVKSYTKAFLYWLMLGVLVAIPCGLVGTLFSYSIIYVTGLRVATPWLLYLLPVGGELVQYDTIAVNTIVKNRTGEVSFCDILFSEDLEAFNREYLEHTAKVAQSCEDRDLSADSMVIGTSAIVDTELDGAVGMNSGIFNNPFMIWGRYRKRFWRYTLPISLQFHHTQMDGAHAGRFLENLQMEINNL